MNKKIVIVIGIVAVAVIVGLFALWASSNVAANSYCKNWAANIDQQRAGLEDGSTDVDSFNRQVEEFNRECAY